MQVLLVEVLMVLVLVLVVRVLGQDVVVGFEVIPLEDVALVDEAEVVQRVVDELFAAAGVDVELLPVEDIDERADAKLYAEALEVEVHDKLKRDDDRIETTLDELSE